MWFGGRIGYRLDRKACQDCIVIIVIVVMVIIIIVIIIIVIVIWAAAAAADPSWGSMSGERKSRGRLCEHIARL